MSMFNIPKTHWIWIKDFEELVNGKPMLVYFRKNYFIEDIKESLKLRISADTRYKLYINGTFAEFGPARGDMKVWYEDEVEIAPYLKSGENIIAVEVLRYPLAYRSGNFGMFRTPTPSLFIEELVDENQEMTICADETWKCKVAKNYEILKENHGYAPLMYLEEHSGDADDKGWKQCGYDDNNWESALAYDAMQMNAASCPGNLMKRPIPYLTKSSKKFVGVVPKYDEQTARLWNDMLKGQGKIVIPADKTVIIELNAGELMCGYLSLMLEGGTDAVIRLLTSEGYVQDGFHKNGFAPIKGDRCDFVNGHLHGFTDIYHVSGYGNEVMAEVYEPYWFRTFRFIQLEVTTVQEDLVISSFDYKETGYPLESKTNVTASDETLAPIWDISLRTLKRCMHETYEDCPFYEQLQYAMDSRSEILYTYMVSADDRLARQCMDDFRRSQRADGMINSCYPHYGPNVIPGFSIYYIMMVYDHMMYFGDEKLVRSHLSAIDQILEYFDNHLDARGIVGKTGGRIEEKYWSFIDWAIPWGQTVGMPPAGLKGPITMESFLYVMGLQHGAILCDYVGRNSTADEYRRRATKVQEAINIYCRDENGVYLDGPLVNEYSQHCQVFALLTNTVSLEEGKCLLKKTLMEKDKYAQCTVSMSFYLFRALEKACLYEETASLWDTWRNMVKNNLTTCVENYLDERSDCHAWSALLLYELPAVILGVRPAAPGFEKISIAPVTGYLSWAKGEVATKWGMVKVEWKKQEDNSLDISYQVPEAMKGNVICCTTSL